MTKHKKKGNFRNWLIPGIVILVLLTGVLFLVKIFLTPDSGQRKNQVAVTLLKPPPPPEQKEKPPEPVPPKEQPKENIVTPNEAQQQNQPDQSDDSPPPGADLGVDAEGGAGGDSFGLVGKKGGRAITLGGGGGGSGGLNRFSLLTKYNGYLSRIQDEIKQQMRKRLDQDGGGPKGKYQATVHIVLDPQGTVLNYRIVASSGNDKVDDAIKLSLTGMRVSRPPPEGMPRSMTLRVSSQG